jgi:hypothetical protein
MEGKVGKIQGMSQFEPHESTSSDSKTGTTGLCAGTVPAWGPVEVPVYQNMLI